MNIITILFLSFGLSPKTKDTTALVFNKYNMSNDVFKLPSNYYTTKTGFFCNTERLIQKQTKLAVKIRLGSVEHTQKLEGYSLSTLPSYP
ncbi:MAG: hypothetical protein RL158_557 [Bacteroidota bacterium]|jgi:hypothetical protein